MVNLLKATFLLLSTLPCAVIGQVFYPSRLSIENVHELDQIATSMDFLGNDMVLGSPYFGNSEGVAMLYSREDDSSPFRKQVQFVGPDAYERFGTSVALMQDGVFVGAPAEYCYEDSMALSGCGIVFAYIKRLRGGDISEYTIDNKWYRRSINAPVPSKNSEFGHAIATSWNRVLAVGAPGFEGMRGQVYVFELDDKDAWVVRATLESPSKKYVGKFGSALAFYEDTLAVSAPGDTVNDYLPGAGSVSIYTNLREISGSNWWAFVQRIVASDPLMEAGFGTSISLGRGVLAVGSVKDTGHSEFTGAAYIYTYFDAEDITDPSSRGHWEATDRLIAHDGAASDEFGCSISLYKDTLVVGACGEDGKMTKHGRAWQEGDGDYCGDSSDPNCVSYSGEILLRGDNAGAIYVYQYNRNIKYKWTSLKKVLPSKSSSNWRFGGNAILQQDTIIVGADGASGLDGDQNVGAAFVIDVHWNKSDDVLRDVLIGMLIGAAVISGAVFIYVYYISKSKGYFRTGKYNRASTAIDASNSGRSETTSEFLWGSIFGGSQYSSTVQADSAVTPVSNPLHFPARDGSRSAIGDFNLEGGDRTSAVYSSASGFYSVADNGLGANEWGVSRPPRQKS